MDLCRGSLLAQIWTDTDFLSPPERRQLADFIALLKANPDCFGNSRFILGNPWKSEPYGYCCTNGRRAFLAIHNACLKDSFVTLRLGPAWGLPDAARWDVYRWYPQPARLRDAGQASPRDMQIMLRPYSVVLLEAAPAGQPPSLGRSFSDAQTPTAFAEPTRALDLATAAASLSGQVVLQTRLPVTRSGGMLLLVGGPGAGPLSVSLSGREIKPQPVWLEKRTAPLAWTAWRAEVGPADSQRELRIVLAKKDSGPLPQFTAHFIPR